MTLKRSVGDVRPSQLITTFGPGAIVDLQTLSVIVAGIDEWPADDAVEIHELRLERALRVRRFLAPKPAEGKGYYKRGTVPAYPFPQFQVCPNPSCRTLSHVSEGLAEFNADFAEFQCKAPGCQGTGRRRSTTMPAPFIVACPSGHIDDFPWRLFVHRGQTSCKARMKFYSIGKTGAVGDLWVECTCAANPKRSLSDAFGEDAIQAIGPCTKRRPWLGLTNYDKACKHQDKVRTLQRGATNGWFSVVKSALSIKEATTPIGRAISQCSWEQIQKIKTQAKLEMYIEDGMFEPLVSLPADEVWKAIQRIRGDVETDDVDLRLPEWDALKNPGQYSSDKNELFLETSSVPPEYQGLIKQVVLARKLMEVRALLGFTRIEPPGGDVESDERPAIAPLYRESNHWLPAVQVRGEGIFIEICEEAIASWESRPAVQQRASEMAKRHIEWESLRNNEPLPFPGARHVMLHSLAHALIQQLALDCGYSASSIRERIYCSTDPTRRMAGILLYTASADSEGSLGGLVDLGSPQRLPGLLRNALASATQCSSDPMCADHQPDIHATVNGAACHACLLVSETSCENWNRFLDRNMLVPTMAYAGMAFFRDPRQDQE